MSRPSLTAAAAATAGLLVPLAVLERRMQSAGGVGMIPFELAGPDSSAEILRAWGAEGQRAARASLVLDFPFLVAYTTLNVRLTERACDALTAQGASPLTTIARVVVAVQVVAGVCDAVENAALLSVITREGDARLSALARSASCAKFAGLIIGWLYGAAVVRARFGGQPAREAGVSNVLVDRNDRETQRADAVYAPVCGPSIVRAS